MFNDTYWALSRLRAKTYPWEVVVFNVTPAGRADFTRPSSKQHAGRGRPIRVRFKKHGLPTESLDDYLAV